MPKVLSLFLNACDANNAYGIMLFVEPFGHNDTDNNFLTFQNCIFVGMALQLTYSICCDAGHYLLQMQVIVVPF